ncbi:MAG TPA: 30S ribosomal protein S1 [Pseudogracilibacillus sp.]|nr:30S ribosomal protein S1 [Pseudogracilibacillus sp.]
MEEMNQSLEVGSILEGTVVKVEEKQVLVDIGQKSEGIIPIGELSNLHVENPSDIVSEGDTLTLEVKKISDEEVIVSKKLIDAREAWKDLQVKYDSQETFTTEIKEVVKGGLVADVGLRGFIPASLVESHFVEDFSDYKGRELEVKIADLDQEQNRIILSHRAVTEEAAEKEKQQLLQSLEAGQVVKGTVQRITSFGAFVDIGGVDGLVHISELSHTHVENVSDVLSVDDAIEVEILSVDLDNERISLSYKNTLPGPWDNVEDRVKKGDEITGTVKRLVTFGAFVEIEPGVEGLVHISQIANRHIGTPEEVLSVDDEVRAKVLSVDEHEKRISLSMKEVELEQDQEDIEQYEKDEDASSFQIGDILGDKLSDYKND